MRVINGHLGTWHIVHFPMDFAGVAHVAPSTDINYSLYSPPCVRLHFLGRLIRLLHMAVILGMECFCRGLDGGVGGYSSPTPLHANCSPASIEASIKTNTGKRCWIVACFEPAPNCHFSNSPWCNRRICDPASPTKFGNFATTSADLLSGHSGLAPTSLVQPSGAQNSHSPPVRFVSLAEPSPDLVIMPRLCKRMRSRRGSSRGRLNQQRPPPVPAPAFEVGSVFSPDAFSAPPPSYHESHPVPRVPFVPPFVKILSVLSSGLTALPAMPLLQLLLLLLFGKRSLI